jgi:hypothetical protein
MTRSSDVKVSRQEMTALFTAVRIILTDPPDLRAAFVKTADMYENEGCYITSACLTHFADHIPFTGDLFPSSDS